MLKPRRALFKRIFALSATVALGAVVPTARVEGNTLPPFVLLRDAWGAEPPVGGMAPHRIDRITLHHTGPPAWHGMPPAPAYLRAIQSFHVGPERRWPDIAYHLLIDLDGAVWEGRSLAVAGDSATEYDPDGHALIAVLGDYGVQQPNPLQRDAIVATVRWLIGEFGVAVDSLRGHRDYAATACPGDYLTALLGEIRGAVAG